MIRGIEKATTLHWLVGVLVVSNIIFAAAQILSHRQVRDLLGEIAESKERLSRAQLDRSHLLHRVASIPLEGEFLSGTDVRSQEAVKIEAAPPAGVYYLLDSSCPACPQNYKFLNSLVREGVFVVGIAPKDELESLRVHARQYELRILVLEGPAGALMNAMPQYGTPLTVVYRGARLAYLRGGVLTPEEEDAIRALVLPVSNNR